MDPKFVANERVLCFEPDVKKMRVIYDASVLKVADKAPEQITISCPSHFKYLVHFRGWNSSWDRYVDEDCLLKVMLACKELAISAVHLFFLSASHLQKVFILAL
jgi:hypothetical protein